MNGSLRRSYDTNVNTNLRKSDILPPIRQSNNSNLNLQRRKKLGESLTKSLVEKFNDKTQKKLIEREVNEFLKRDRVSQNDLKNLESLIAHKIKIKTNKKQSKEKLLKNTNQKISIVTEEKKVENSNKNISGSENQNKDLNVSGMSGGSDLDKFDGIVTKEEIQNKEMEEFEKFNSMSEKPVIKSVVLDTSKYHDEWDAINMYNKKMYEERIRREKEIDRENKLRNRHELYNQIQEKIKRK